MNGEWLQTFCSLCFLFLAVWALAICSIVFAGEDRQGACCVVRCRCPCGEDAPFVWAHGLRIMRFFCLYIGFFIDFTCKLL